MAMIELSEDSDLSLVRQIVAQIKQLVDTEVLRPGSRVMSIRHFARDHGISTYTVAEAYERLVADDYFRSLPRSGYFISPERPETLRKRSAAEMAVSDTDASRSAEHGWQLQSQVELPSMALGVGGTALPSKWMEDDFIGSSLRAVAGTANLLVTRQASPHGYAPLCDAVQARMEKIGVMADSGNLVLTDGAVHGMDLLIRCFLKAGDCVLVEDPGYVQLFASLRLHGVTAIPVRRLSDGPDLDQLDMLARKCKPAMFFTQSVLHDPTGSSTSPANAHRLLKLAELHGLHLVENDVFADLIGPHYPRLATLDQLDRVFYVGSFSEALPLAMRVGFIAGPAAAMQALRQQKLAAGITGSQIDQRVMHLALTEGHYQRHVDRLRERLGNAMQHASAMLSEHGMEIFCRAQGGKFLWVCAATVEDSTELAHQAANENIFLAPGKVFRCQSEATAWFRFNIAYARDPGVVRFISRLGRG